MSPLPHFTNLKSSQQIWMMSELDQREAKKMRLIELFKKDMDLFNDITRELRKEKIEKIMNNIK